MFSFKLKTLKHFQRYNICLKYNKNLKTITRQI